MNKQLEDSIEHLEELTNNLPAVPTIENMVKSDSTTRNYVSYDVVKGSIIGIPIMWDDNMAIQKIFSSAGSEFKTHVHENSIEMVVVISGQLIIKCEDAEYVVNPQEIHTMEKNRPHNAITPVDTWIIAVTIPADEFYPKP